MHKLHKALSLLLCVGLLFTAVPEAMATSEAAVAPESAAVPEVAATPEATAVPEVAAAPEATAVPEVAATPEATAVPDATVVSEATAEPEATVAPETTAQPGGMLPDYLVENNFHYVVADEKATVVGYADAETVALILPRTLGGKRVTAIGERAFAALTKLERIELHGDVEAIASGAFPPSLALIVGPADSYAQAFALELGIAFEADAPGDSPVLESPEPEEAAMPGVSLASALDALNSPPALDALGGFESEVCVLSAAQSGSAITITLSGAVGAEFWEVYGAVGAGEFALLSSSGEAVYTYAGPVTIGQTYRFKARAGKSGGAYTAYSDEASVTAKPGAPVLDEPAWADLEILRLSWSAVPGALGYDVLLLDPNGQLMRVLQSNVADTSVTVSGLLVGDHRLAVRAYMLFEGKRVIGDPSNVRPLTVSLYPSPAFTKAEIIQETGQINLEWARIPNALEYNLWGSSSPDGPFKSFWADIPPSTTSYSTNTYVIPSGIYYFKLQVQYPDRESSAIAQIWSRLKGPNIVSKGYDRDGSNRERFQMTWSLLSDAEGYSYGYIVDETSTYHECGTTAANVSTATYWIDELPMDTYIHFVVYGYQHDSEGNLVWGESSETFRHYSFSAVPQIDLLVQTGPRQIYVMPDQLGWKYFDVSYSYGTGKVFTDFTVYGNPIYLPQGLPVGTEVEVWIQLKHPETGKVSAPSAHKTITLSETYGPTIQYVLMNDARTSGIIAWSGSPGATGYVLQYTPEYGVVPFADLVTLPAGSTQYSHSIGAAQRGRTFTYRIQLQGVAFTGDEPVAHLIIPCDPPVIQGISAGSTEKYKVSVAPVAGADDYDYLMHPVDGYTNSDLLFSGHSEVFDLPSRSYKPGVAYEIRARARRHYPSTAFSETGDYSAAYPFIDLGMPTVIVKVLGGTSLQADWSAVAGAAEYELRYSVNGGAAQTVTLAEQTRTLTGLPEDAQVTVSVRAKRTLDGVDFHGEFAADTVTLAALPVPPAPPVPTAQTSGSWRYIIDLATGTATVLEYLDPSVTALVLPEALDGAQVTAIASGAFAALTKLSRMTIHGAVVSIAPDAFASKSVIIMGYAGSYAQSFCRQYGFPFVKIGDDPQTPPSEVMRTGSWLLSVNRATNTASIFGYDGPDSTELFLPGEPAGIRITAIEASALKHLTNLRKLHIPSGILQIERDAFPAGITLYCVENSYAHRYALANGIAFVLIDRVANEACVILAIGQASHNSVSIQTNTLDFAQGFEVYRAQGTGAFKLLRTVKTSSTLLHDTGLVAGQTYRYKLRAYSDLNYRRAYSSYSNEVSVEIRVLPPTGVMAVQNAVTAATLSWIASPGASGYEVLALGEGATGTVVATVAGKTTVPVLKLTKPEYTFAVRAYKTVGKTRLVSELSDPVNLSMASEVSPRILSTVAAKDAKSVTVKWSAITGATGYCVYAADAPEGPFALIGTTKGSVTSFAHKFKAASHGKVVYYKVTAITGGAEGAPSPIVRMALPCKALKAPAVTFADLGELPGAPGARGYILRWNPVDGADEYDVFVTRTGQGKTVTHSRTVTDTFAEFPLDSESGILAEYSYSFQVAAIVLCEDCGRVAGAKSTAKQLIISEAPVISKLWQTSATSLSASWLKITGASGYRIRYRKSGDTAWKTAGASTSATGTLSSLQAGGVYELQVAALRKLGGKTFEGKYSPIETWTMINRYAPKITKCAESNLTRDTVKGSFAWTSVKGAVGYVLYIGNNSEEYYFAARGTSIAISQIPRGCQYEVAVIAVFADGSTSEWSEIEYLITKPYTITDIEVTKNGPDSLKVFWWGYVGDYEKVWRASSPTGKRELVFTSDGHGPFIDKPLHPNTLYCYWITSVSVAPDGKENESPFSAMVYGINLSTPVVTAKQTSLTSLVLSWPSLPSPIKYVVTYRIDGGKPVTKTLTTPSLSITTGLFGRVTYSVQALYQVGSIKQYGTPSAQAEHFQGIPWPETNPPKRLSGTSVQLSWKAVKGANGYLVFRAKGNEHIYANPVFVKKDVLRYTDNNLTPGVTYRYLIAACIPDGTGGYHQSGGDGVEIVYRAE